jgi:Predicted transcriptional regulators
MARKKVTRALAPLPNRRALEKAHHKTDALIDILRDVAVKNQKEQPRAFYSVRDVATHFRVPISTVQRTYRHLEQEGLLTRVRGSKTLLQGLHFDGDWSAGLYRFAGVALRFCHAPGVSHVFYPNQARTAASRFCYGDGFYRRKRDEDRSPE